MFEKLFSLIHDMYPGETPVPLHAPRFLHREKYWIEQCIDSTFVSYAGTMVNDFESKLATFTGSRHVVATVNGTTALFIALKLAGVEPDDEVLIPSLTFVATANSVSHVGAHCVLLDVDFANIGLCPVKMESFLRDHAEVGPDGFCRNRTSGRRIKACMPVHVFGHPASIREIAEVCARYNIELIEDATEALGSYIGDEHVGLVGRLAVLSFNGNKVITTGGGGAILTQDPEMDAKARHLVTTARVPHQFEFIHDEVGYNFRLPSLNAALGCGQMEYLQESLANKRETAALYKAFFKEADIPFVAEPEGCRSNYWLNAVLVPSLEERDVLLRAAQDNGIQMRPAWVPMHKLPMYKDAQRGDLSNTEELAQRLVNLPSSIRMRGRC